MRLPVVHLILCQDTYPQIWRPLSRPRLRRLDASDRIHAQLLLALRQSLSGMDTKSLQRARRSAAIRRRRLGTMRASPFSTCSRVILRNGPERRHRSAHDLRRCSTTETEQALHHRCAIDHLRSVFYLRHDRPFGGPGRARAFLCASQRPFLVNAHSERTDAFTGYWQVSRSTFLLSLTRNRCWINSKYELERFVFHYLFVFIRCDRLVSASEACI